MKLVVEYRMMSNFKTQYDSGWITEEYEFDKVGLFKKPEFHIRNLSVKIIKFDGAMAIIRFSDALVLNIEADSREEYKRKEDAVKKNSTFEKKGVYTLYTEVPVTKDNISLSTPTMDFSCHYVFYLKGSD